MFIPKKYLTETIILVENSHMIEPNHIFQILTQDKTANLQNAGTDPITQYYKKLAEKAKQRKNGQKSLIVLDKFKLSKRAEAATLGFKGPHYLSLGTALVKLKELMDGQGGYDPKSDKSNVIQITTLELLSQVLKMPVPKPPEPDPEPKPGAIKDWTAEKAKRLADTGGKTASAVLEQFYEDYYRIEYASINKSKEQEIVDKLKSLNKILVIEFNKLGYNPEANPFAQFLKSLIEHRYDIFEKLNTNNYGAIHNSFISKHITGNMLGNYDIYKDNTILYCNDLYSYKGLDIVNYLALQSQALSSAEQNSKYADDKNLVVKMFIRQKVPADADYGKKIEYLFGKDLPAGGVIRPDTNKDQAIMNSTLEISEMYQYLFKAAPKKQVNIDEITDKAKAADIILDMIQYILDQDDFEKAYKSLAEDTEAWLKERHHTRNDNKIRQCREVLSSYIIKDAKTKAKIVTALIALVDKSEKAKDKQ